MDGQRLHVNCRDYERCLPIGEHKETLREQRLEEERVPASRMVPQVKYEFFSKPMAPQKVILASSAQPWGQKRTTLTQELIRRLLNCSKELSCKLKIKHLNKFMQVMKNSGYSESFRAEVLQSGLRGYNKILEADKAGSRPMYRPKDWEVSSRRMDKQKKKRNWLGSFWKSCIFVPPTPGSELKKRMQEKEEQLRPGGRESWPIKIIEMAGKTLEQTLVQTDPFEGNKCSDKNCIPSKTGASKINCRRNCICYSITCLICLQDGQSETMAATYFGESGKNMHCRAKEHISKFNSKKSHIRNESAFYKHLANTHGGRDQAKPFEDYFQIKVLKSYKKAFTKCVEEGTLIASHGGEVLNSKSEWHQAKVIRTTTRVLQGGADVLAQLGGGHQGGQGPAAGQGPRAPATRTRGQG